MKKFFIISCITFLIGSITIGQDFYLNENNTTENIQELGDDNTLEESISSGDETIENTISIDEGNENILDNEINNKPNEDTLNNETNEGNNNDEVKYGLGNIIFGFCNEGDDNLSRSLNYAISQGKPFDICVLFYNSAPKDLKIKIRIVDQEVTAQGDKTCNYSSKKIQQFIPQETLNDLDEIILPSEEYVKKKFQITFPIGMEGNLESCFSYYIPKESDEAEEGAGFAVIINDGFFMNFFVGDLTSINNTILFENINAFKDGNGELNLKFNLINTGNLENEIVIKGTIKNIFGFQKDFTIDGDYIQAKPGDIIPVSAVLGSLPSYGGLYNIEFTATATPFFSYDISNSSIDPTLLEAKEFTASTTYFQMPWLIIIIVVIVILLIITIFRKPKEKVVYVQTPQQPTPNNGYNAYQQPQYQVQQPQVAQPQYQQPQVQPQYGQPTQPNQDPNNYGQPNQQ